MKHKLKSWGPNPYGWMCYCIYCGKNFANYKDHKTSPCKKPDEIENETTNQSTKIQ